MNGLTYLFTGGWAAGYRTYIAAAVAFATVAGQYAIGDINLSTFVYEAALALGLGALRAGSAKDAVTAIEGTVKAVEQVVKKDVPAAVAIENVTVQFND